MTDFTEFLISPKLWISIIIIIACIIFWFLIKKFVNKTILRQENVGKKISHVKIIVDIIRFIIFLFAIIIVLQINGINVSSLVTGLGVAGIIVGFALQNFLNDIVMGINIVWDDYFSIGDVVKYENFVGEVIGFSLKVTKIRNIDDNSIFAVSNRNISKIEKLSDKFIYDVPAPYTVKYEEMKKINIELCNEIAALEDVKNCEYKGPRNFNESSIAYRFIVFTSPIKQTIVQCMIREKTLEIFDKYNIEIPFNQLDVNIKNRQ